VGAGTSCGVGLSLPGKTCFDHQSDWEGITIVFDRRDKTPVPVAVQFAQHGAVVRYGYQDLLGIWRTRRGPAGSWPEPLRDNFARISDLVGLC
jgi:hypothetical protein